jgi:hypothetical protein
MLKKAANGKNSRGLAKTQECQRDARRHKDAIHEDNNNRTPMGASGTHLQYADFEETQEEAIPCHSRRGLTRESIMTHS